ncbi:MAG: endo alpha-1,4 polygalactosaminidase [Johnsonella sp.]|nr:endo alpha-1,4 polygalactosaminidase [Johnsonella sp.]
MNDMKRQNYGAAFLVAFFLFGGWFFLGKKERAFAQEYGVFLSIGEEDAQKLKDYRILVIDAQYFSADKIRQMKAEGHEVYSYLNIGSLEDFRPYYREFSDLLLSEYENWEEEAWIDIREKRWQEFILGELSVKLLEKGVDGFFIDNADIYDQYPEEEFFLALERMLRRLKSKGKILLNGGDVFLREFLARGGGLSEIIEGINQETVFSSIDFEEESFGASDPDTRAYFKDYIEDMASCGAKIYLLEYGSGKRLEEEVKNYCDEKRYRYYISDSIELD